MKVALLLFSALFITHISYAMEAEIQEKEIKGKALVLLDTILDVEGEFYFARNCSNRLPEKVYNKTELNVQEWFKQCSSIAKIYSTDFSDLTNSYDIYEGFRNSFDLKMTFYTFSKQLERKITVFNSYSETLHMLKDNGLDTTQAEKIVILFLTDCFSVATLLEPKDIFEDDFYKYLQNTDEDKIKQIQVYRIVGQSAVQGLFNKMVCKQLDKTTVLEFKKLTKFIFSLSLWEPTKERLKDYFKQAIANFKKFNRFEDILGQIEQIIQEVIAESSDIPLEVARSSSWKKAVVSMVILSGTTIFALSWLNRHQYMFERYPFLIKLFPFLYQSPLQKSPAWFEKWFWRREK